MRKQYSLVAGSDAELVSSLKARVAERTRQIESTTDCTCKPGSGTYCDRCEQLYEVGKHEGIVGLEPLFDCKDLDEWSKCCRKLWRIEEMGNDDLVCLDKHCQLLLDGDEIKAAFHNGRFPMQMLRAHWPKPPEPTMCSLDESERPNQCECGGIPKMRSRFFSSPYYKWSWRYYCPECGLENKGSWSARDNAGYFWNRLLCERLRAKWEKDPTMKESLEAAGWRYVAMVGMLWPGDYDEDVTTKDREKHPNCIRASKWPERGISPFYVDSDAYDFVHEVTGYDRQICQEWMKYDWE